MKSNRTEAFRMYDNRPTAATELARRRIREREERERKSKRTARLAMLTCYALVFVVLPLSWALAKGWVTLPW